MNTLLVVCVVFLAITQSCIAFYLYKWTSKPQDNQDNGGNMFFEGEICIDRIDQDVLQSWIEDSDSYNVFSDKLMPFYGQKCMERLVRSDNQEESNKIRGKIEMCMELPGLMQQFCEMSHEQDSEG